MSKVVKFITSPIGAIIGGKAGKLISAAAMIAIGVATGNPTLIMAGIASGASALRKTPKPPAVSRDRLFASLDPQAPRKIVYGRTAMATDVRYQAFTGANQEYYHQIMCVASHEVEAIEEIWFDTELAWTAAAGAQGRYAGYLTVTPRLVGTASNGIAIDGVWTSACTLTGCAYVHLRFKLTGNDKKAESPFAQQVPSRVTVRGKGAKLYEARLDSTAGGSGSQRVNDQATWAYAPSGVESGRNPALQLLHYLIGWRINGKLAIGRGMPAARFDMASFITAANMCDEAVAKAAGGTEPRYRADGVFSEADDPSTVIDNLLASMNAVLRDDGGKISLTVLHNDLGAPVAHFDENDILGDELWKQTPSIDQTFNIVRGSYTDASDTALYQMVDAPQVAAASIDGIDRIETFDLAACQSPSQWQRLAKQRIQRALYAGVYSANFGARAWQVSLGKVVTLSHVGLGWDHKLFRVIAHGVAVNGVVPMALIEEHPAIYAWDKEETPAVQAAVPTVYDPTKAAVIQAIAEHDGALGSLASDIANLDAAVDGKVTTFFQVGIPVAEGIGDLWFKSDTRKWYRAQAAGADEIRAGEWVLAEDAGIGVAIAAAAGAQATADGKVTTYNQQAQPTSPAIGDLWVQPSAVPKVLKRWSGTAWVAVVPASLSELDSTAKADLDAAKASIAAISSDAMLSTAEKPGLITSYNQATSQWTALDTKAAELAPLFDTQRTAAAAAKTALVNYLTGLSPAWNNTSANTPIVASTFQSRWSDFYTALFNLDAALTARPGSDGLNNAAVYIFRRAAAAPTLPSVATTYNFATAVLSGLNNGWSQSVPAANGNPLYVSAATASSASGSDTIAAGEWATPVIQARDGAPGSTGAAGLNTATVWLYQRAATPPAVPAGTTTYTFDTGVLSGTLGSWSQSVPAGNGNPLYVTTATALGSGATDTIATGEWAAVKVMAQDGAAGNDGAMAWTPVLDAAISRTGSTFRKASGGSAWVGAYSSEKTPQASASAKATQANANFLVGLNGSPGGGAVDVTIEHAAWLTTTGTINYWKSGGTAQAGIGTYAVGDVIGVAHRDNRIVVLKNGDVIYTDPTAVSASKAFALHIGIFSNGTSLDNVTMARGGDAGPPGYSVSPGSQAFSVASTANGTPKTGELPKTVTFLVLQGATDISDDAATTYSAVNTNVTATMGGTNGKVLTATALSADTGKSVVTVKRSGVTIAIVEVTFTKARDGFGSVALSDDTLTINNTASYTGVQGGPITMTIGPGGTVKADVNLPYAAAGPLSKLAGKVQYRTTPGSGAWVDIGSETQDPFGAQTGEPGSLLVQASIAGPTPAANWEFQFVNRRYSGATTCTVNGTDDVMTVSWSGV